MPYIIVFLVMLLGGSGFLLKSQYELTGKQEVELLDKTQRILTMQGRFNKQIVSRDNALTLERSEREKATRNMHSAQNKLNQVKRSVCYDKSIPDGAAIGVQQALSTYTGPLQTGDPRNPAAAGSPTCRDLANYFPHIVGALEQANTQLRSISALEPE